MRRSGLHGQLRPRAGQAIKRPVMRSTHLRGNRSHDQIHGGQQSQHGPTGVLVSLG